MFKFSELIHSAEDLVVTDLLAWFQSNSQEVDVYASRYTNLLSTGEMVVTHSFPMTSAKLPYVIVDITNYAETTLGFGWQSMDPTSLLTLTLTSTNGNFDVRGKVLIIKQLKDSRTFNIDFPSVLFADASAVSAQDVANTIRFQVPSSWYMTIVDGNVLLNIRNTNAQVLQGAFGLSAGTYTTDTIQNKHIGMDASLNFDIGAGSEKTRKDLVSLIFTYIEKLREEHQGTVGDYTSSVVINSPFRQGGDVQAQFGSNDTINQIYITSVSGDVYIDITDIEGRVMEAVTAVDSL